MKTISEIQLLRDIMKQIPSSRHGDALPQVMDLVETLSGSQKAVVRQSWRKGRDNDTARDGLWNNLDRAGLRDVLIRETGKLKRGRKRISQKVRASICRRFNISRQQLSSYAYYRTPPSPAAK